MTSTTVYALWPVIAAPLRSCARRRRDCFSECVGREGHRSAAQSTGALSPVVLLQPPEQLANSGGGSA
jgi:hypothetical protein